MASRNLALNKFLTFERPVFSKAVRVCNFLRGGRKEKKGAGEMITTVRTCVVAQVKRKRETSNQPFLSLTADRVKIQVRRKESFLLTALSETSSMRREEELRPYTCCHEAKKCSIHTWGGWKYLNVGRNLLLCVYVSVSRDLNNPGRTHRFPLIQRAPS